MTISQYFPIYDQLDKADQERLDYAAVKRRVPKGTLLHGGDGVCTGLLVIASGQLRAHMISEEGREITLYRLFERDICLLSASCMMPNIQFEVSVQAWERTEVVVIPAAVYQELAKTSPGRWSPGCESISRPRAWYGFPGGLWRSWTGRGFPYWRIHKRPLLLIFQ